MALVQLFALYRHLCVKLAFSLLAAHNFCHIDFEFVAIFQRNFRPFAGIIEL